MTEIRACSLTFRFLHEFFQIRHEYPLLRLAQLFVRNLMDSLAHRIFAIIGELVYQNQIK